MIINLNTAFVIQLTLRALSELQLRPMITFTVVYILLKNNGFLKVELFHIIDKLGPSFSKLNTIGNVKWLLHGSPDNTNALN